MSISLNALKAAIDYQVSLGNGECLLKVRQSNGALVESEKLEVDRGEQELIPENPAPAPVFILQVPQA